MEIDKTFDESNICVLLFNLRHVIHIPYFRIVNLLRCGGHFNSITFTDGKTKNRSPYLLDVSQPYLQNHTRTSLRGVLRTLVRHALWSYRLDHMGRRRNVCRRRPQDVGRGCPLASHIGHYANVLRTLHQDVLKTSYYNIHRTSVEDDLRTLAGDVPWRYLEHHMGTSIGCLLGKSLGRPRECAIIRKV